LADCLGPQICVLKTHIDILSDFDSSVIRSLQVLAKRHQFLIFEDRKFADIGHTVGLQYAQGIYRIAEWASLVTVHAVAGPGSIQGLAEIGLHKGNGGLLLVEMSSQGSLAKGAYQRAAVKMVQAHSAFIVGVIARHHLVDDPTVLHFTPGVKLVAGTDTLGQQYITPGQAISERGSDVIIVGRGICASQDPVAEAAIYRDVAWRAYQQRLGSSIS